MADRMDVFFFHFLFFILKKRSKIHEHWKGKYFKSVEKCKIKNENVRLKMKEFLKKKTMPQNVLEMYATKYRFSSSEVFKRVQVDG